MLWSLLDMECMTEVERTAGARDTLKGMREAVEAVVRRHANLKPRPMALDSVGDMSGENWSDETWDDWIWWNHQMASGDFSAYEDEEVQGGVYVRYASVSTSLCVL